MSQATEGPLGEQGQALPLEKRMRTRRLLTYLMLFAIVMFFAGLTSAYVVSMSGGYWVHIRIPRAFFVSTAVILASSVSAQMALTSTRRGRERSTPYWLLFTFLGGLVFSWSQFRGWSELVHSGNFLVGKVLDNTGTYGADYTIAKDGEPLELVDGRFYLPSDQDHRRPLNAELNEQQNNASSYLYVLTAAHLAHLAFGLLALLVMAVAAWQGRYSATDHAGLWSGVLYWHFLAGLWVYLLLFLTFVH
ncbi:MAG: heme-copper oxidase subunit III [Flavobacteriales bacterium]|nr:heme-copper oxidase subunit III [Flavobacteriales bacterium]MCB9193411.1 heme-copper oxidase subunit III [Flavobacteriales bacterium]